MNDLVRSHFMIPQHPKSLWEEKLHYYQFLKQIRDDVFTIKTETFR